MGDGGNGGSGGEADGEPLCGSFETLQNCSAVGDGDGGVTFVQERRGACFFV